MSPQYAPGFSALRSASRKECADLNDMRIRARPKSGQEALAEVIERLKLAAE